MRTFYLGVNMSFGWVLALSTLILLFMVASTPRALALSGSEFNAGRIIDDAVFYNKDALNSSQIQQFLNSKVPSCDTNGAKPYGNTTRAGYGTSRGYPPPYTCLKNYSQSIPSITNSGSDLCKGSISAGTKSAAQIIYDVSQACGVNPQVLIVLLQKEQSLVTDDWPWSIQYRSATGYGCPDTAPCDSEFYGFFNQVYQAAKAYKRYQANPTSYNYRAGRNNTILWNPNAGCGTSSVYIVNQATAGLYIYTPYRPNQAALNNLYGSGDGCSSYGNRNFWRIFVEWFGSVRDSYTSFETPRWMVLNKDQRKMSPGLNAPTTDSADWTIPQGTQLRFESKIWADGQWYYRTAHDTNLGANKGIPASSVSEIQFQPFATPRWMTLTRGVGKVNPRSGNGDGSWFAAGTNVNFNEKIFVNGSWYYRTRLDADSGRILAFPADSIAEANYINFNKPRYIQIFNTATKQNPILSQASGQQLMSGQQILFSKKIQLGDNWYCQTDSDAQSNSMLSVNCNATGDIPYANISNGSPSRWLVLNTPTRKIQPSTGALDSTSYETGLQIEFSQTITVNGIQYLRSKFDVAKNNDLAIPTTNLSEIAFLPFESPRPLRLTTSTYKVDPKTNETDTYFLNEDINIDFASKILVGGRWYFRTLYDTNNNNELAIPAEILVETNN